MRGSAKRKKMVGERAFKLFFTSILCLESWDWWWWNSSTEGCCSCQVALFSGSRFHSILVTIASSYPFKPKDLGVNGIRVLHCPLFSSLPYLLNSPFITISLWVCYMSSTILLTDIDLKKFWAHKNQSLFCMWK